MATSGPSRGAPPATVKAFFSALSHPLKTTLRTVCTGLAAADPQVREGIKWNAPSYYVGAEQYFATANIHGRGKAAMSVLVVLHRGAKAKGGRVTIDDPEGLIEWLSPDRGAVRMAGLAEARRKLPALQVVVRQWIAQL